MRRLDELMNLAGELVINRTRLEEIGTKHKLKDLNEALTRVSQISNSLQTVVMQVRMVPVEQLFERFPRMVRDLSKKLNKKINLVVEGKETEMDRTVIDEIGDPMVHLIRNSIDHGIELPEDRIAKGKPEVGTITLVARHEGNNVLIEVKDDGKGVDPTIVGRKAVEKGMFTQEQINKMAPEDIQKIIYLPGFSTAATVSDISGRGVGMDAVKAKLEDLNGVLELESKVNEGSKVTIKLPLTLAILPALMVRIGKEVFAIPLGSVQETMDITRSDINIVQHQEVTLLRGDVLPIIRLRNMLDVPTTEEERKALDAKEDEISIVVCSSGEKRAGFMVDELQGQQEIVIKSLGNLLSGIPGIMGATMRGDGDVALILDIPAFFQKGQSM
jgi:two-component system chemotaxis sensor kinase CheA